MTMIITITITLTITVAIIITITIAITITLFICPDFSIGLINHSSLYTTGEKFTLYTHSYLGFGAERARESLNELLLTEKALKDKEVQDPCLNQGEPLFSSSIYS